MKQQLEDCYRKLRHYGLSFALYYTIPQLEFLVDFGSLKNNSLKDWGQLIEEEIVLNGAENVSHADLIQFYHRPLIFPPVPVDRKASPYRKKYILEGI